MSVSTASAATKSDLIRFGVTLVAGVLGWVGAVIALSPQPLEGSWGQILLLFAPLVIVPLGLRLVGPLGWPGRVADIAQYAGAIVLVFAFFWPPGDLAALLSLPWLAVTALVSLEGLLRIARRRLTPLGDLCRDAGLVFLVVGGMWTTASRWGMKPLDFDEAIVLLTANHFHYAGFVVPIVAGLAARELLPDRFNTATMIGVLAGVPLVAVGITATKLGGPVLLECVAALVMAVSGIAVANMHLRLGLRPGHAVSRTLFVIAALSLAFGMILAGMYGVRFLFKSEDLEKVPWLTIPWMRLLHGTANVFGFSLAVLAGWLLQSNGTRMNTDQTD